jgi:tetratricopeptide (TPR) repeat protein
VHEEVGHAFDFAGTAGGGENGSTVRSFLVILLMTTGMTMSAANGAPGRAQDAPRDPDRLYENRAQLASALEAAAIWEERLKGGGRDFEAAWKLARACYWLGSHVPADTRRKQYERGIEAAARAVAINAGRPEGHFWMAADMGTLAESFGLRAGLRYRGVVKRELETVLAIDPSYQEGSADRALGRWYLRVPGLLGGSKKKSVEHLQRSLTYDPGSAASHFFLAETFVAMGQLEDARRELQKVLDAPVHPDWVPEVSEFKQKARALLEKLRQR